MQGSALSEAGHLLNGELNTLASGWEALRLPSSLHPPFAATATIMGKLYSTILFRVYAFHLWWKQNATWMQIFTGAHFFFFHCTFPLIGSHITTFDLHHYHFLGPCSYLLARDFVNGTFSLVGVYQMEENTGRAGLASVRIITHDATNVTLHVNGSVDATEVGSAEVSLRRQFFLYCNIFS